MSEKKIYIKIDKPIEVGDLVRCVEYDDEGYDATLHPDDTWDTLTGIFVALSKAAGRKLPDWIYGEIDEGGQR